MPQNDPNSLRAKAEAQLLTKLGDRPSEDLVYELIYELNVHSVELEMQNEELRRSHIDLEESRNRYIELYEFAPVGYLTLTSEGLIVEINLTAAALLGMDRSNLLKHRFAALVTAQDSDAWYLFFTGVMKHNERQNTELMLKRGDGTGFYVQLDSLVLTPVDQEPMLRITLTDITERKLAEQSLKESETYLHAVFNATPDAMLISDAQGIITMANQQAERLLGYPIDELAGLSIDALVPERFRAGHPALRAQFAALGASLTMGAVREVNAARKDGSELDVEVSLSPIQTNRGLFYACALRDITERKQAERELHKFKAIIDLSMDGFWTVDLMGNLLQVNEAYAKISGYSCDELVGMHISQLEVTEAIEQITERVAKIVKQGYAHYETRHRHKDGHTIDVEISAVFLSEFQHFGVFCRDISERKRLESAQRIAAIAFESQEGVIITDPNAVIIQVNQAFTRLTGYSATEVVGMTPHLLSSGRHAPAFYQRMWTTLKQQGFWQGEIWNRRKNGEIYLEWLCITAVNAPDGCITHYVASFSDITSNKEAADKIHHLANYDPLTLLPNRRQFQERLAKAMVNCERRKNCGALLFIDLDNFKTLNDTLGHDMGDELLIQVANRLVACMREGDTVARLGGDEFVIILEDLSRDTIEAAIQAKDVGEKILVVLNQNYLLGRHDYHNTPSIGVTLFNNNQESIEDLLKRVDIAMYAAKAAGRNALRFF